MAEVSKVGSGLLELRTDVGRLYVCPSGWQRLYLRWTFRNFHILPRQVLSRHQQNLIERLCRSAIVSPAGPVPSESIIGVVENMHVLSVPASELAEIECKAAKPTACGANVAMVLGRTETVAGAEERTPRDVKKRVVNLRGISDRVVPPATVPHSANLQGADSALRTRASGSTRRLLALGAIAAALVGVAVVEIGPRLPQTAVQLSQVQPAAPTSEAPVVAPEPQSRVPALPAQPAPPTVSASETKVAAQPTTATLPAAKAASPVMRAATKPATEGELQRQRVRKDRPLVSSAAAVAAPRTVRPQSDDRPQIAGSPKSGFAYPVTPGANLVGKVSLRAVIGTDGAVKQVEVLSGNRSLAAAAIRAVRQWHYTPAEVQGRTVEAETRVTISFLGDDAVSVILPPAR